MTENTKDTTTGGSGRIPRRGGAGHAGPSDEPKHDHVPATGAGRENGELEWARRHVPDNGHAAPGARQAGKGTGPDAGTGTATEPVQGVFRKTELHDTPPDPGEIELKNLRSRMMQRLRCRDPEILYLPFETAFRDFICSLLARQYREETGLRAQVAALWAETELLDDRLERSIDRLECRITTIEKRGRT